MSATRARWSIAPYVLIASLAVSMLALAGGCPGPDDTGGSGNVDGGSGSGDGTDGGSDGGGGTGGDGSGGTGGDGSNGGSDGGGGGGGGGSDGGGSDPNSDGSDPNTNGGDPNTNGGGGEPNTPPIPTALTFTILADTASTAVPGQAQSAKFTDFGEPVIDEKGRVAFWATFSGTDPNVNAGLYYYDGQLKLVAHNDPNTAGIVPSRTGWYFGSSYKPEYKPLLSALAWGAGDRLMFVSDITDGRSRSQPTRGVYRYRVSDSNFARVMDYEQIAATFGDVQKDSTDSYQFQANYDTPGISDAGIAIVGLTYTYISTNKSKGLGGLVINQSGTFSSNGTAIAALADTTQSKDHPGGVPEQGTGSRYTDVASETTISQNGDGLVQAAYTAPGKTGSGVYLARNNVLYRVIDSRTGAAWPGLPADAQFGADEEYRLAIGPLGHIVVEGSLTTGGATRTAVLLWDWETSRWSELTGPDGEPASALISGANDDGRAIVLSGSKPYLVGVSGRTQLDATLPGDLAGGAISWRDYGGAVNNHGRAVLRYAYGDAVEGLVFWTGQQLLIVADGRLARPANTTKVTTVLGPERDRPGRSGLLNDRDELVFRVERSDGSRAIYLARAQ